MSLKVFMALCILGCDFLLYVLFQWMYGEKRRKPVRKASQKDRVAEILQGRPYVVKPEKNGTDVNEPLKMSYAGR